MLRRRLALLLAAVLASALAVPTGAWAALDARSSQVLLATANLTHVKNVPFAAKGGGAANRGTDVEFATIKGVRYAIAGSYQNGLQIVDISDPANAFVAGVYDCGVQQGDVQVFTRMVPEEDGTLELHTFAAYTHDTGYTARMTTACYKEANALGFKASTAHYGTFIADITDVANPKTVSFVPFSKGSHNQTVHPSGNYLYNSNSDLITSTSPAIEIWDISDFSQPKQEPSLPLPFLPTGLGAESHDITFNTKGDRAYTAALGQTDIIDTTNPARPKIISTIVDPAINVHHQSDPVTITDPILGKRDFLVIEDEFAGALGTGQCPNGGVHVYDVTGSLESSPVKVGYWNIDRAGATTNGVGRCTAHVFDLHEDAALMTIAYYNGGVRVVDISGLVGVALGGNGVGMRQLAAFQFANSDTWAAKTPRIEADGDFWLFGNDQARGLDVYRFDADVAVPAAADVWLTPAQALAEAQARGPMPATYKPYCLLGEAV